MADWHTEVDKFKHFLSLGEVSRPSGCEGAVSGSDVALSVTEAIIATHAPVNSPARKNIIFVWARVTTAAVSTDPILAVRKGTLVSDPLIGEAVTVSQAASLAGCYSFFKIDSTPAANQAYVFTGDMTTGTGTATEFGMLVFPIA